MATLFVAACTSGIVWVVLRVTGGKDPVMMAEMVGVYAILMCLLFIAFYRVVTTLFAPRDEFEDTVNGVRHSEFAETLHGESRSIPIPLPPFSSAAESFAPGTPES